MWLQCVLAAVVYDNHMAVVAFAVSVCFIDPIHVAICLCWSVACHCCLMAVPANTTSFNKSYVGAVNAFLLTGRGPHCIM